MESYNVECGFVCWDGGKREVQDGVEVCILEKSPGYLAGSGLRHTIVIRHDIRPGTLEWNLALDDVIRQAEFLKI